jgi:hypothetical protein
VSTTGSHRSLVDAVTRRPALDALRSFLADWHGIDIDVQRWTPDPALPPALALLLPHEKTLCRQHHLVLPEPDGVDSSRLVFYVENQGVGHWAYRPDGTDDPPVSWAADGTHPWTDERMRLAEFLLTAVVVEATVGSSYKNGGYTGAVDPRMLAPALAPLRAIGERWNRFATQCYVGEQVIAFTASEDGTSTYLWIAAQSPDALRYLNGVIHAEPMHWLEIRVDGRERYPIDGF